MTKTLKQFQTVPYSRIYSYGQSRGSLSVTNDELAEPIDSSDEWIRQRTGIITRTRGTAEESVVDFATEASLDAFRRANIDAQEIGAVLISTISHDVPTPSMAALVAEKVGANPAAAYDISAACAGFTYGVAQADAMVRSGLAKYVLVIGAEKLSELVDPTDRTISFLLGDGAGAAIIGPSDFPGISPTIWGSDGSQWDAIHMTNTMTEYREGDGDIAWPTMRQNGRAVFRWAVWEMVKVAKQTIKEAGLNVEDLAAFIPHQANMRIIDEFAKQLGLPDHVQIARDIATTGNTSAASIPLAAGRLLDEHPELSGGFALQIGFGAGLVFGAQVVVLP